MRMTAGRKAETRERILDAAGELFGSHGIDAVGVDAVMHRAGLTHGGFYAHFASKEALVADVSAAALARSAARWERISQGPDPGAALARIVETYLDPAHVDATEHGCVLTTLGPEMARRQGARPAITASIRRMLDALARCLPARRRQRSLAALSTMVGAVVLARLCDDRELAGEFLAAARGATGLR
jgi:TetR/AcrR family transcriptional repressor of nem operon